MRVKMNPEEVSGGFELVKPGTYQLNVVGVSSGSGAKGPYLKWELEVLGATENSEGNPISGRVGRIYETTTLAQGSRWRLQQLAVAAGLDPIEFDTDQIVNRQVTASVDIQKDPGYPAKMKVERFLKP